MHFGPNKKTKGIMSTEMEAPKNEIDFKSFDPDAVSKRTLIEAYRKVSKFLTITTVRLFFYAPNDDYFAGFSDSEREMLTQTVMEMYGKEKNGN